MPELPTTSARLELELRPTAAANTAGQVFIFLRIGPEGIDIRHDDITMQKRIQPVMIGAGHFFQRDHREQKIASQPAVFR